MSANRQAEKDPLAAHNASIVGQRAEEENRAILHHLEAQDELMIALLRSLTALEGTLLRRSNGEVRIRSRTTRMRSSRRCVRTSGRCTQRPRRPCRRHRHDLTTAISAGIRVMTVLRAPPCSTMERKGQCIMSTDHTGGPPYPPIRSHAAWPERGAERRVSMVSYEVSGSAAEGYVVHQVEGAVRRRVLRVLRMEQGLPRGHLTTSSARHDPGGSRDGRTRAARWHLCRGRSKR